MSDVEDDERSQPIWVPPTLTGSSDSEFFEGLDRQVFLLAEDASGARHDPRDRVDLHGEQRRWVDCNGSGSVVSWSRLEERAPGRTRNGWKAAAAIIALDDGPWWWGRLMTPEHVQHREGMRVKMLWGRGTDAEAGQGSGAVHVPYWGPDEPDAEPA